MIILSPLKKKKKGIEQVATRTRKEFEMEDEVVSVERTLKENLCIITQNPLRFRG